MEPKFVSLKNTITPTIQNYLKLPAEKQRYLWYTDKINKNITNWENVCWYENDDLLVYSESIIGLRMGKNLFPSVTSKKGFSLDKKVNKLKMWYMSQPKDFKYLDEFLKSCGKEWVVNEGLSKKQKVPRQITQTTWMTKGLLEKILLDKITNPTEACNYIIKANRLKGVNPGLLKKYIKENKQKGLLLYNYDVVTDPNKFIEKSFIGGTRGEREFFDLLKQAKALGKKVNLDWSENRIDDTHQKWTKELMEMDLQMMEEEVVDYKTEFTLPEGFELIKSRRRLFEEGKLMNHCVYTNYWNRIQDKRYMVLHVGEPGNKGFTAGIHIDENNIRIDQIRGRHNISSTKKIRESVKSLLNTEEFVEQLKKEFKTRENIEVRDEEYLPF